MLLCLLQKDSLVWDTVSLVTSFETNGLCQLSTDRIKNSHGSLHLPARRFCSERRKKCNIDT